MSGDSVEFEQRFAHLLNPIKDLARNWDIDIAAELQEYMDQLDTIAVTIIGRKTAMNFAQAALVLQGTAQVYSKKVELLYNLCLQVLEFLHNKKKKQTVKNAVQNDTSQSGEVRESFLSLDDDRNGNKNHMENTRKSLNSAFLPRTCSHLFPKDDGQRRDSITILGKNREQLGYKDYFTINQVNLERGNDVITDCGQENGDLIDISRPDSQIQREITELPEGHNGAEVVPNNNNFQLFDAIDDAFDNVDEAKSFVRVRPLRRERQEEDPVVLKQVEDPWSFVEDVYLNYFSKDKPIRKGRPYKLLANNGPKAVVCIAEFIRTYFLSHRCNFPKRNIPTMKALDDMYWIALKEKLNQRPKPRETKYHPVVMEQVIEESSDEDEDVFNEVDIVADVEEPPLFDDVLFMPGGNGRRLSLSALNQVEPGDEGVPMTYEEIVKARVDQYLTSAREYRQVTDLDRRVTEWESRISPTLEAESLRPPFDVRHYGTKILSRFADSNRKQTLAFRDIAKTEEK